MPSLREQFGVPDLDGTAFQIFGDL